MRKLALCLAVLVLVSGLSLGAQQANPSKSLAWDQQGATLAEVQGFIYKHYPDAATAGVVLAPVTCAGAVSPFQCETPFPAFTPGAHVLTLTATGATGGESSKSTPPLAFTFTLTATPQNVHIK